MEYQKYYKALDRQWTNLEIFSGDFLQHYNDAHHTVYRKVGPNQMKSSATGLILTEGQALVKELIEDKYLLFESNKAFWDLFARTRLLKDEKLITFTSRALLETFERRISFLAFAPSRIVRRKISNYLFIGAHLWQDSVVFSRKLIAQMKSDDPGIHGLSTQLTNLVSQGKLKEVMKRMSFTDGQYVQVGSFLNADQLGQRENLYAIYSMAIHGDPFAASALQIQSSQKWHFLLPKSFQIMLACESADTMLRSLVVEDCARCNTFQTMFLKKGSKIKTLVHSNEHLFAPNR